MTRPPLIDERDRVRIATDLAANLCVEAAAGTGKTTVLVGRVAELLATGTVNVDELVVITFTEKAAAELATRVRDELDDRARTAPPEQRTRLHDAARTLYRAHIETIHSFATALLRERPVEAEIDPLFEVLEGLAGGLDFDAAYTAFEDGLLAGDDPGLERALRRGLGLGELREACEHLNHHRYLLPLTHPEEVPDDLERYLAEFGEIATELGALLRQHAPGEDKLVDIVERIIAWTDDLMLLDIAERERLLVSDSQAKTHLTAGAAGAWGGDKPRIRELQERYRRIRTEVRVALREGALLGVLPHIERFVTDYAADRRRRGRADFDDLLFWARDLLRDSEPARRYFRERFRAVLIDEFQDTDPVQAELALLLTSDDEPGDDWRELRPAPGRLTIVGDPKQSIYRFRRADIAVYDQVCTVALAGGAAQITTNFRSNPALLAALNHAFDRILEARRGVQPPNVRLAAPPGGAPARRAPIVVAEGALADNADGTRAEEARVIAGLLHRCHTERWMIRDRRIGEWRDCGWGDMAILMPARTGLEHYEEALVAAGIPHRHEGSRDFYQRDEVRDLVWVLAAIDDPTDRVALVGALRSGAFALSDDALVIHAADTGGLSYRSPATGSLESVNLAMAELADLHRMRRSVSLSELVRRVVERTRLVELALTRPDGEQGAANLLAIVDQARLFAAAGGGGLRAFIRYLSDSMEAEAVEMDATVAEETDDVVRIMTTHGAKGLEYPIVALANLGTQYSPPPEPVADERRAFLHFRVGSGGKSRSGHFATPGYDAAWDGEKGQFAAERLRLLYVAATRARDHLIIPCVVGRLDAKHLLGDLIGALPLEDPLLVELIDSATVVAPAVEGVEAAPVTEAEVDRASAEREAWGEEGRALRRLAGTEREIKIASSRERAQGPLAAELATFDAALILGQGPPLPVGDAVHMVMERVSLPDAANLNDIAEDVCLEGDIEHRTNDVIAMCRACLNAPSVRRATAGPEFWREVAFVVCRAEDGEPADRGPLTNGRVDLVFRDGEELVVVDYKTDEGVTEETAKQYAIAHHGGQGQIYAQGLAAATGLSVREVVFVYCKAGAEVRLRRGDGDALVAHLVTGEADRSDGGGC